MIRIRLPDDEVESLERVLRTTAEAKLRHRAQIVLMAHRGRPRPEIAADTGTSQRSVQRWLNAYLDGGLDRLRPRKAKGAAPKLTEDLAPTLRQWVNRGPGEAGPGPGQLDLRRAGRAPLQDPGPPGQEVRHAGVLPQARDPALSADLPLPPGRPAEAGRRPGGAGRPQKGAEAGELVLLSQDEARFPMVPTLSRTLGVKGHRPAVGTRDCKDLVYVFAVVNVVTAALHANLAESPKDAAKRTGKSKTRRLQEAFAAQLRHVGRVYPRAEHARVVLLIDNAPWHAGQVIDDALADDPHPELKRLPSSSPQLNVIERFWRLLRRRATHNRLFGAMADLKRSLRASLGYYQTVRDRVRSLVAGCYAPPAKQTQSAGS